LIELGLWRFFSRPMSFAFYTKGEHRGAAEAVSALAIILTAALLAMP
jgi:hypothetical protein